MTVNRIGGTLPNPEDRENRDDQAALDTKKVFLESITGALQNTTISRAEVMITKGRTQSKAEAIMASDARAQKLAEIRRRMEAGVYNSRGMIEQVVDRLIEKWKLGVAHTPAED